MKRQLVWAGVFVALLALVSVRLATGQQDASPPTADDTDDTGAAGDDTTPDDTTPDDTTPDDTTPDDTTPDDTAADDAMPDLGIEPPGEMIISPGGEVGAATQPATELPADTPTYSRQDALLASLTIFVLAVFVGFEVITKVPPTLHTPLMSGSNAISGITVVGALLAAGFSENSFVAFVGMIALALAAINVVGGFLVTHRMLEMFQKRKK